MATLKAPKKPKLKALPKKPKTTAAIAVWERYNKRAEEVIKHNKKVDADYQKALKNFEAAKKAKAKIIEKYQGVGKLGK